VAAAAQEGSDMRKKGTVISFSNSAGFGMLHDEAKEELRFESSQVKWRRDTSPTKGQSVTYETGANAAGEPRAVNLQAG
jgi:cold shock CspA family protein